jgi:ParB family transcriptional regulator, chromosome partitioning protein
MTQRPQPRRGLGRGLGSLIPTAPPRPEPVEGHDSPGRHSSGAADAPAGGVDGVDQPGARAGGVDGVDQPGARAGGLDGVDQPHSDLDRLDQPDAGGLDGLDHPHERGLDQPALDPVHGAYFAELPVAGIRPNPRQPRQVFDEDALAELVYSIQEVGLLQPVVVRPSGGGEYELVMGERRWRATQQAGLETIPAIVRETGDDDLLRDALLENLHRAELNPLEEAAAYQQLLDDFGCTHDELATRIGRSRPQISNTLRLLKLTPTVQRRVAAGVLSAGHARALLGVEDADDQDRLAGRVVAEGISVRGLEELVAVGDLGADRPAITRRSKPTSPGLEDLASRLSDRLETRVKVDLGKRKGRITVEFASLPDLERIIAVIDPGHTSRSWNESTG